MSFSFASPKILRWGLLGFLALALVFGTLFYYHSARAAAELTISPITWDIIGLDSNDELTGPNHFPIGARVCNNGDEVATNVTSEFVWDSTNNYINLRSGSLSAFTGAFAVPTLAVGECVDFYYEVEIERDDLARETSREYHITATADTLGVVSTPIPRKLYVEYLISQSRNATMDVLLDGVSVPAGGTMALVVGETYEIELVATTATQGYNQIENFINFTNTIFRVNSVETSYNAFPTPHTDSDWDNKLYADGCSWDNDPNSPNFQSCLGVGKYGGDVTVKYNLTVIGGAGSTETLSSLIYDFSGSSFHYNADYSAGARFAAIINPSSATISKFFTPSTTDVNGVSTLTFILSNPNDAPLTGANFIDTFPTTPGAMVVATPATYSTSGCGSPSFAPTDGATFISFSDGTIPANGTCVVNVMVTVPVAGDYDNSSGNLFLGTVDTGNNADDTLSASITAPPACTPGLEMAVWDFETSLVPIFQSSRVSVAAASYAGNVDSLVPDTQNGQVGWSLTSINGSWPENATASYPIGGAEPYFQFEIDTINFTDVAIKFDVDVEGNWANAADNHIFVWSNANGGAFETSTATAPLDLNPFSKNTWYPNNSASATLTGSNTTAFRINELGAKATGTDPRIVLDNVVITGCGVPQPPSLTKAFSPDPIAVGGISTLIFNLTNENNVPLTGVRFTDVLPAGLEVAATPNANTTCGGTPNWAPTAGGTSLEFGTTAGATIPARVGTTNGSCTVQVDVTATTGGVHQNVSGFIYSTETYTNTTSTGSGSDTLTALLPPQISKIFSPDSIVEGGVTTLTFVVTNPNPDHQLTGVQFSDTFPTSPDYMVIANPTGASTSGCGSPTFAPAAGDGSISFTGGTIAPGGACTVKVNVTAPTTGSYDNSTGTVSADIAGDGNTANDTLIVTAALPSIAILKQVSDNGTDWTSFVSVPEGSDIYYQFTVENTGDVALTGVTVTDPTLNPIDPYTVCTIGALALYEVQTCTFGPITAVAGWNYNTANAHGTYNSVVYDSNNSTASYATTGLSLVKSIYETAFTGEGDVLHYSYVVENTGAAPLLGPVTIDDDQSTNETCPPVSSVVPDGDAWLDPGESITCSATYTVQSADVTAGSVTNIASASVDGASSNQDTVTVNLASSDYGDLPSSYNITLQANDGPRHTRPLGSTLQLGPNVSTESDGQESATADLDTFDDGVFRDMTDKWTNGATVDIDLYLQGSGTADVGIWIDWNNDGSFGSGEFSGFTGLAVGSTQRVQIIVPSNPPYGVGDTLNVRVRAFVPTSIPGGSLDSSDFVGLANDGEVEDYQWQFRNPNAVSMDNFSARSLDLQSPGVLVSLLLAGAVILFLRASRLKAASRVRCDDD